MPLGYDTPQGEDMAMMGLSELSFYHAYSFPKAAEKIFRTAILLEDVSEHQIRRWESVIENS